MRNYNNYRIILFGIVAVILLAALAGCDKKGKNETHAPPIPPGTAYGIIKWSGDNRKGNPLEHVNPPFNYQISVATVNAFNEVVSQEDVRVKFEIAFGKDCASFIGGLDIVESTTVNGYAQAFLVLEEIGHIEIDATAFDVDDNQLGSTVTFTETCFNDQDHSEGLPEGCSHERVGGPESAEIPGDGVDDGDLIKHVWVEVDYIPLASDDIADIINYSKEILETARVEPVITKSNEITGMDSDLERKDAKGILADNRDKKDCIHVVLGTSPSLNWLSRDTYGVAIQYWREGYEWECAHLASGDPDFSQPYLDSTGCFVFLNQIPESPSTGGLTWEQAVAVVLVHEVGHALGLGHSETSQGVMQVPPGFGPQENIVYGQFNHFVPEELDDPPNSDKEHGNAMNTREVLGRETVDYWN